MKRYFISHSSTDKPLALDLKALLDGDAWVDLHEIDVGDIVLEQISAGIEDATDFMLLWSAASALSPWVKFEFHMAFTRWLEDNAIAIRVVCLQGAPEPPLYLRTFLQVRGAEDAHSIASALGGLRPAPRSRRTFLNRNAEISQIEDALYSSTVASMFISGLPGSGKRSLAREALLRLTVGSAASHTVAVGPGIAETELDLLVARSLGVDAAPEGSTLDVSITSALENIDRFAERGGIWVFEDVEHWLTEEGTPGRILRQILAAASNREIYSRLLLFTSRRRPRLSALDTDISSLPLHGLKRPHSITLLRNLGVTLPDSELVEVTDELDGHPLALEVVAARLPLALSELQAQRHEIATDLVDADALAPATWSMLELLAVADGPVTGEDLARMLERDSEGIREDIAQASQYSLVSYDSTGFMTLHPLVRDFFLRSFRMRPDSQIRVEQLAETMKENVSAVDHSNPLYVPALLAAVKVLGLAGRFEEARSLRKGLTGTLLQTAQELYHERRYNEVLAPLEESLTGSDDVDKTALQLKIKTLAHLKRLPEARELGDRLVAQFPEDSSVLRDRGRIEYIDREWKRAIEYYERAIPFRHNPANLWADVAQARMRLEDPNGTVAAARLALKGGAENAWILSTYSEALEQLGDLPEAKTIMQRAVNRDPSNAAFRHRLGRIAQRAGDRPLALEQFRRSAALDPGYFQSRLSIASLLVVEGDLSGAQHELDKVSAVHGVPIGVLKNIQASIYLSDRKFELAAAAASAALAEQRDVANLVLVIRTWIERAEAGEVGKGQARAKVRPLARELDDLSELRAIVELNRDHPEYFA